MAFGTAWWAHALGWGGIASLLSAVILLAVLFRAPYAFLHDLPEDIRRAAPTPSLAQQRQGRIGGAVFLVVLLASLGGVVLTWGAAHPGSGFWELTLMALVAIVIFMLVDLVLIDWLVICAWRPAAIVLPGTQDCAGWRDYGFHVRELLRLRSLPVLVVGATVLGGLAWWLT